MSMIVNRRDLDFVLYETLGLDKILESDRYADYDRESLDAIMDLCQTIAEDQFLPCAAKLDANEPKFVDGKVETISELKEAIAAYQEAGLCASAYDSDVGGMQLPWMMDQALNGMFVCANNPAHIYLFLTQGVANMLNACGSDELKRKYLPDLVEGNWFGTMCLSEPQAGSSLADIRTKADLNADGSYSISGTKMWISGGEQDITENIIHMVLAKIPGSPPGVKGISLFLVPKNRVNDDGSIGDFNNIALAGLNHKMGCRGATNCLLNFGESGDSIGYLVGEPNQGLANMFHMMNEARISVGMSAVMTGLGGYLYSLDYARNRPQGRPLVNRNPEDPQIMISEHADIKRMLMTQKAFIEGAQTLIYYCAELIDTKKLSDDKDQHQRIDLLLDLLTPICKSWPSEYCLEANKLAIQVLGGYGYTREYPVERLYRDNRLNHIHEGTWGIQGLDILGRKVRMHGGAAVSILRQEIQGTIDSAGSHSELVSFCEQLGSSLLLVEETIDAVGKADDPSLALANATIFLDAMGHFVIAWMWLKQAVAALEGKQKGNTADDAFYEGKVSAMKFFFNYELPKIKPNLELVAQLDSTCYDLTAEQFLGV
ncbi:acyl-CoA dehydrogenase [Porticoccaceae bacterium]|jgi:butyryl-CoA dehydrogenase|nr:acyl-CoA dehydrogenase [Porticoccaceae bacterium]MDA8941043.1 acyl-CoA dehydrogenase [Porticoccaceae bacterium]MDB2399951.1 acyl-CoA dehydrogenase [Porticoccaceae bacterium]